MCRGDGWRVNSCGSSKLEAASTGEAVNEGLTEELVEVAGVNPFEVWENGAMEVREGVLIIDSVGSKELDFWYGRGLGASTWAALSASVLAPFE